MLTLFWPLALHCLHSVQTLFWPLALLCWLSSGLYLHSRLSSGLWLYTVDFWSLALHYWLSWPLTLHCWLCCGLWLYTADSSVLWMYTYDCLPASDFILLTVFWPLAFQCWLFWPLALQCWLLASCFTLLTLFWPQYLHCWFSSGLLLYTVDSLLASVFTLLILLWLLALHWWLSSGLWLYIADSPLAFGFTLLTPFWPLAWKVETGLPSWSYPKSTFCQALILKRWGCGAYLQYMCFIFGYLDIVYIWNALIWSASQAFPKHIQSENVDWRQKVTS